MSSYGQLSKNAMSNLNIPQTAGSLANQSSTSTTMAPPSQPIMSGQQTLQQQLQAGPSGQSSQSQHQSQPMPSAADISLMLSLGLGLNASDVQQLANWDLQKLAMYLVSN